MAPSSIRRGEGRFGREGEGRSRSDGRFETLSLLRCQSRIRHSWKLTLGVWSGLWDLEEGLEEILEGEVKSLGWEVTGSREIGNGWVTQRSVRLSFNIWVNLVMIPEEIEDLSR